MHNLIFSITSSSWLTPAVVVAAVILVITILRGNILWRALSGLLLVAVILGALYLRGWFSVTLVPTNDPKHPSYNVTANEDKVESDLHKAKQGIKRGIRELNSQSKDSGSTPPSGQQPLPLQLSPGPIPGLPADQPGQPDQSGSSDNGDPQIPVQTQGYQYTPPVTVPPPGEGR